MKKLTVQARHGGETNHVRTKQLVSSLIAIFSLCSVSGTMALDSFIILSCKHMADQFVMEIFVVIVTQPTAPTAYLMS